LTSGTRLCYEKRLGGLQPHALFVGRLIRSYCSAMLLKSAVKDASDSVVAVIGCQSVIVSCVYFRERATGALGQRW
jgi:hypothetical protein